MTEAEEIAILKDQIEVLSEENKELKKDKDLLMVRNLDLVNQIEKMKCCENCLFFDGCSHCNLVMVCKNYDKWELAE